MDLSSKRIMLTGGAGFEISIKDLAELIARLTGFKGNLICRPLVLQYCP
jgi:hypothetical protein